MKSEWHKIHLFLFTAALLFNKPIVNVFIITKLAEWIWKRTEFIRHLRAEAFCIFAAMLCTRMLK